MAFDYAQYTQSGDYISFNEIGDSVIGIIKQIREGTDFGGNPCPELILEVGEDADEKTLTAGQVMLKTALAEKAPQVGDKVKIVFSGTGESRPGRTAPKLFTVDVKPGPHELQQPAVSNSTDPF